MDFIFVYLFLSWVVDTRIFIILFYERIMHHANEFCVCTHEKYWFCIFFFCLFFFLSSCTWYHIILNSMTKTMTISWSKGTGCGFIFSQMSVLSPQSQTSLDSPVPALRNSRLPGPSDPEQKEGTEVDHGWCVQRGTSAKDQV